MWKSGKERKNTEYSDQKWWFMPWQRGTTLKFRDPVAKSRVLEACSQGVLVECGVMISQDENMNTTISQRRGVELVVLGNAANQLNCQKPCRGTQRRTG
jgi:hypothetical protein